MRRRRYLIAAGTVLFAGCSGGDSEEQPTPTSTATERPTATATETETDTPTETETETPSGEEQAAAAIDDARSNLSRAHAIYLSAGTNAETILDITPDVTGIDVERIRDECDSALSALETASETATDDQEATIRNLEDAVNWLSGAAEVQRAMGDVVARLSEVESRAGRGRDYSVILRALENTQDALDAVDDAMIGLDDPRLPGFRQIEGIDADAVADYNTALKSERVYFDSLSDPVGRLISGTEGLEWAEDQLDQGAAEEAEQEAQASARAFGNAEGQVNDIGGERFAGVRDQFSATVEELEHLADDVITAARADQ
jgi:hypothetical protein